jgi:hypothetical protein
MMSLARDNQNQLGRHASFTRLFENMSQKGVTANTDQSVAPALSALPYEDRSSSLILSVLCSVSSFMSRTIPAQLPHPNIITT